MRKFYSLFFYLMLPAILLRLLWRARLAPAYSKRWNERFGYFEPPEKATPIWIHAVSLGEVIAAAPLVKALQQQYPDMLMTVTTTTPTGSQQIKKIFQDSVFHVYLPLDVPDALSRFMQRINPKIAIIMETELWPNLLAACHGRKIQVFLANARLSEKSAIVYRYLPNSIKQSMQQSIHKILAQSGADKQRFIHIGFYPEQIEIAGNIKYDMRIDDNIITEGTDLRKQWGIDRPVWIAASTHEGEDEIALAAHKKIQEKFPDALLILVPRHPERFDTVTQLCQSQGFTFSRRTDNTVSNPIDVFIANTVGELLSFYAASDIAFVGGSLVSKGGHNLLEPAKLQKAIITGPHTENFTDIFNALNDVDAINVVNSEGSLAATVIALIEDRDKANTQSNAALQVVEKNSGALEQHLQAIKKNCHCEP